MKYLEALPDFEIIAEVSKLSNIQAYQLDLNMANQIDCKFYPVNFKN